MGSWCLVREASEAKEGKSEALAWFKASLPPSPLKYTYTGSDENLTGMDRILEMRRWLKRRPELSENGLEAQLAVEAARQREAAKAGEYEEGTAAFLEAVFDGFARGAPRHHRLVVKARIGAEAREVALPLEAINKEAAREKSIRHGHPSTLHLWWARRPLAAARAVIFTSLVDDPDDATPPDSEELVSGG